MSPDVCSGGSLGGGQFNCAYTDDVLSPITVNDCDQSIQPDFCPLS
jgi:hypothetical protein